MIEDTDNGLFAVILAAGEARRFGTPKQIARLGGDSLLARADARASAVCGPRKLAVVGAHIGPVQVELTGIGLAFVISADWRAGPGAGIAAGVRALAADCAGTLIWHADQALLEDADLVSLRDAWAENPARVVAARYGDSIGAPVIFPRRLFPALRALDPAGGAKHIIAAEADRVEIPMPSAAIDIDTREDLASAERQLAVRRARGSRNARS